MARKMKKFVLFYVVLILILSGCSMASRAKDYHYSIGDMDVTVKSIDGCRIKKTDNISVHAVWKDFSNYDLFENCDMIMLGKVESVEEYSISYTNLGADVTDYGSVLTINPGKVFYGDRSLQGKPVKVNFEFARHTLAEDAIMPEAGEEYYFFLRSAANDPNNLLGYENFVDYLQKLPPTPDYMVKKGQNMPQPIRGILLFNAQKTGVQQGDLNEIASMDELLRIIFSR